MNLWKFKSRDYLEEVSLYESVIYQYILIIKIMKCEIIKWIIKIHPIIIVIVIVISPAFWQLRSNATFIPVLTDCI